MPQLQQPTSIKQPWLLYLGHFGYLGHCGCKHWLGKSLLASLFLSGFACWSGCGSSGPPLAPVRGKITFNGQPLPGATIQFQPEGSGSPSKAITDKNGQYQLLYPGQRVGAMIGKHRVIIETYRDISTAEESGKFIPEKLAPEWHAQSNIIVEVTPEGLTDLNWETAQPPPANP